MVSIYIATNKAKLIIKFHLNR